MPHLPTSRIGIRESGTARPARGAARRTVGGGSGRRGIAAQSGSWGGVGLCNLASGPFFEVPALPQDELRRRADHGPCTFRGSVFPDGTVINRSQVGAGRFQEEQLRHNPKISRLCPASVKPCSFATWFAHDSMASAEISTAKPQERHTRWWWWVSEHMR